MPADGISLPPKKGGTSARPAGAARRLGYLISASPGMSLHRVDNDGNYEPGKALCKPPIVVVVARAKQEQAEQEWREQQAREAQQFATSCNDLAGNPNDQHRRSEGVSYDHLKTQIPEAIRVCELAVQKFPEDLTLQYQLARAVELVDPARGQRMQDKLVKLGYPAAFDNAGSLLLNEKGCRQHCINEAVKLFRKGVALGDPDAMMSLADQIGQNHATGDQISLYQRAAKLGHPRAIRALETLAQERMPPRHKSAARQIL
jgi:hypothetical protein